MLEGGLQMKALKYESGYAQTKEHGIARDETVKRNIKITLRSWLKPKRNF